MFRAVILAGLALAVQTDPRSGLTFSGCGNIINGHLAGKLCFGQKNEAQAIREAGVRAGHQCRVYIQRDGSKSVHDCDFHNLHDQAILRAGNAIK